MAADGEKARRPAGEGVEREPGRDIDDGPQSRLGERRRDGAGEDEDDRRRGGLRGIGDQRRQCADRGADEQQDMNSGVALQPVELHQREQGEPELGEQEQRHRAANKHLGRECDVGERRKELGNLRHVPIGAEHDDRVEHHRRENESDRLDDAERAMPARQREQGSDEVSADGERGAVGVDAPNVRPGPDELPER